MTLFRLTAGWPGPFRSRQRLARNIFLPAWNAGINRRRRKSGIDARGKTAHF
jgi:hypothetical protein